MTDQSAQEPTMEEILASIRRIISEDDAPAETPAPVAAAPEPEVVAAPEPDPVVELAAAPVAEAAPEAFEEEVLELTERYDAPAEVVGDLDVLEAASEPFSFSPEPEPEVEAPAQSFEGLVSDTAAASAASAFATLATSFKKPDPVAAPTAELSFISGNSVEAMVAEMLRPMLKDWLETNLPAIVEDQVRKEVERIARTVG